MQSVTRKSSGRKTKRHERAAAEAIPYLPYFAVALATAFIWTLVGAAIAYVQGDLKSFLAEWQTLQGPFLIGIGTLLMLVSRSGALENRAHKVARSDGAAPSGLANPVLRVAVVVTVLLGGSASIIGMGFNARGPSLWFIWLSCVVVCCVAGIQTLHTIDLLLVVHRLEKFGIKTFSYSPARTPELRGIISYFTSFTLILSIGYLFAFIGMIRGHWTANPAYIEAVQWFWPLVYVPVCSIALIYPHLVMHRLVKQAKEKTLNSYQSKIDQLLGDYKDMGGDEVQKINNLAQLFDRISATPDYVVDFGIAVRTFLPLIFNLAILIAKPLLGQT